jgi:hypothetical protein
MLLLRVLTRRLLNPSMTETLLLRLEGARIDLIRHADAAATAAEAAGAQRSDTGHAVGLLDRLAQHLGWELEILSPAHIRIGLPATTAY